MDLLKYCSEDLKDSGILVQHRSYKKSKDLPLVNAELKVEAGQKVTFFKYGQTIVLATKGQIYDPKVKAEHIPSIFKDYTEEQIKSSDEYSSPENRINSDFVSPHRKKMRAEDDWKLKSEDKKCPLCMKNFSQDENELIEHASRCSGIDDSKTSTCPICQREYPADTLVLHAQECAHQFFD